MSDTTYLDAMEIVSSMCVVNDGAERGVKLCHDFISLSKEETKHQNVLQIVENDRNQRPKQRITKEKDQDKRWFIKLVN